ncbi:hypothetical protein F511_33071 [Dorcoceras hygrometricum]|uniref:Uncharacterized protein n=1 Tax=Dorcoceras hygrometricum TaxID=472368 RepID=A0A2Z7BI94_9LAMI|nr:hypothetical protein F511_33071 [Dorcoceras hygrometricum]
MLLSRSADTVLVIQRVLLRTAKRQRFDKLERRRGMHSFVSADEVFSRSLLKKFSRLVKSIYWRLRYDSVWNQQMEKRVCISADEFFQAFFQSKLLTTMMDVSADFQSNFRRKLKVFEIRSFALKEKICWIVQLPGMKETR